MTDYISPYRLIHLQSRNVGSRALAVLHDLILVTFLIENLGIWANDAFHGVLG